MRAKLIACASVLVFAFLAASVALPHTQTKGQGQKSKQKVVELKATKPTTRGEDPNIKSDTETNDPNSDLAAPEQKGGAKTRGGGYCEVRFDNRTRWFVKLYVDGIYRGTLSPFGDSIAYTGAGATRVYARADFTDGNYLYWGPSDYSCYAGQFIYFKMNP
jgi:hypothetical protein